MSKVRTWVGTGKRDGEKVVGSLTCVSWWNQNISRGELGKEELVVS